MFSDLVLARGRARTERCPRATYMRLVSREGPGTPVRAGCGVLRAASRAERRGEQMESEVFSMQRLKGEGREGPYARNLNTHVIVSDPTGTPQANLWAAASTKRKK